MYQACLPDNTVYEVCTALEKECVCMKTTPFCRAMHTSEIHHNKPCMLHLVEDVFQYIQKVRNSSPICIKIKFPPSFVPESVSLMGLDPKNSYMNMCPIWAECIPIYSNIKEIIYSIHC